MTARHEPLPAQSSIDQLPVLFKQYLRDLWAHRWLAAAIAWVIALIGVPVTVLFPNRYEASARIFVDTQTVLKPLMAGLTFQPDVEQQVKMLARIVVTRPNMEQIMSRAEAGFATLSPVEREKEILHLMQQIKIESAGTGNIYSITYRDTNRDLARKIVESTLDLFVSSNSASKRRDAEEAGAFIEEQIKTYEAKLVEAENNLKEFKVRNFGVSGVSNQDFFVRISSLADEVSKLQVELSAAEQSREAFRRELATESPQLPVETPAVGIPIVVSELDSRLETQKKLLDELLRRYTDEHPDVTSTRRAIAQLEAQKRREAEEKAAAERASGKPKASAATSPIYQRLRVALAETEAQVASLKSQLTAKRARLDQLRAVAGRVPQVEAELAQLNRDYDVVRKNYEALVARRESAAMGKRLDESSRLAEFRVVEPPRVAPTPVAPSRLHMALGLALMAVLAGLASPIILDLVRPTFKDARALRDAIARPILGSVSLAVSALPTTAVARRQVLAVVTVVLALLLAQGAWLAWLASRATSI